MGAVETGRTFPKAAKFTLESDYAPKSLFRVCLRLLVFFLCCIIIVFSSLGKSRVYFLSNSISVSYVVVFLGFGTTFGLPYYVPLCEQLNALGA